MFTTLTRSVASRLPDDRRPDMRTADISRHQPCNFNGLPHMSTSTRLLRDLRHHCKPIYTDPAFCYTTSNAPRIIGGKAR
jgi:hypothetical protein